MKVADALKEALQENRRLQARAERAEASDAAWRILCGGKQKIIEKLEADLAAARARVAELETRNEQLQVQLAGCGVAALQNTRTSIAERVGNGVYGYSASYQDVCNAVDREIEWRERAERAESDLAAARALLSEVLSFYPIGDNLRDRIDAALKEQK